jgi:hypothetical protein
LLHAFCAITTEGERRSNVDVARLLRLPLQADAKQQQRGMICSSSVFWTAKGARRPRNARERCPLCMEWRGYWAAPTEWLAMRANDVHYALEWAIQTR